VGALVARAQMWHWNERRKVEQVYADINKAAK
jgi:hypothetical protein